MASTDKTLGRLSAWSTLVVLAGFLAVPFLPARAPRSANPPPAAERNADTARSGRQASQVSEQSEEALLPLKKSAATVPPADIWTEAELTAGLRECLRQLAPVSAELALEEPMKKGQCGTPAPVRLRSIGGASKVKFTPQPQMNCRLAAGLARWVKGVLQPAAREVLGSRVTRIIGASSYTCRNMYNKPDLPLSEHATGNAVDIAGFVTADGRTIRVAKGWGPTERDIAEAKKEIAEAAKKRGGNSNSKKAASDEPAAAKDGGRSDGVRARAEKGSVHRTGFNAAKGSVAPVIAATASIRAATTVESAFLKRLHSGACTVFATVLGPEVNEAHRDHFHFDMKERKGRGVCH